MTLPRVALLMIALALASGVAQAQVEFKIKLSVEAPFVVDNKTLPPGEYEFIINSGRQRLTIRGEKASAAVAAGHLLYTGGREGLAVGHQKNELIFQQFGEERFLSAVWISNQGVSVAKSKRQKELEKQGAAGEEVKVVAK